MSAIDPADLDRMDHLWDVSTRVDLTESYCGEASDDLREILYGFGNSGALIPDLIQAARDLADALRVIADCCAESGIKTERLAELLSIEERVDFAVVEAAADLRRWMGGTNLEMRARVKLSMLRALQNGDQNS